MKYLRALGGFKQQKDAEILKTAIAALDGVGKHPEVFAEPNPPLADLEAAKDDYEMKLGVATQTKGLQDVSLKNEAKGRLADVLQRLAFYVNIIADGHLPTLYASGFLVAPPRSSGWLPYTPERLRAGDGPIQGSVRFDFDRVVGPGVTYERSYAVTEREQDIPEWGVAKQIRSSQNNVIGGLPRQQVVHIRVRAVGTHGVSDWSNPVQLIVR